MVTPLATCHMPLGNTPHMWASSCLKQFSLWTSSFCDTTLASSYISCQTWISAEFFTATLSFNVEVSRSPVLSAGIYHPVHGFKYHVTYYIYTYIYMLFLTSSLTSWNLDISTWISYWHFKTKQVENSTINHPSLNCSESPLASFIIYRNAHITNPPPTHTPKSSLTTSAWDLTHKIQHKCLYFWSSLLPL